MRPAFSALTVLCFAGGLAAPGLVPTVHASLLPQIEEARILQATLPSGVSTLSKHYVEVSPGIYVAVRGGQERRQVRFARWAELLTGDRLAVYEAEGFPIHRLRENDGGVRTETWSYPESGLVYRFSGDTLIEVRPRY